MNFPTNYKKSIAGQLLKSIFGIYFLIAILVTFFQAFAEFTFEKENIKKDLKILQKSFNGALGDAIWNVNHEGITSLVKGIYDNPEVLGLEVRDEFKTIQIKGETTSTTGEDTIPLKTKRHWYEEIFVEEAPIIFKNLMEKKLR